jgi:uncharacterized protein YbjT (DUF2867 family)
VITVVGGSGRLGTALVPLLLRDGSEVRVVSRRGSVPPHLRGRVEVVRADVRRPATLAEAVAGSESVVCAVHGMDPADRGSSPERVDHRGSVAVTDAAAAVRAGVVLVSVRGASPEGTELQRAKWRAEEHLRARGIPWAVVRAPAYLELWREMMRRSAARDGRAVVLGAGRNPVEFVSVAGVARVVTEVLAGLTLHGEVVEVPADTVLTLGDLAAQASRPGRAPRRVPRGVLRLAGQALRPVAPGPARLARLAVWMDTAPLADGRIRA